MNNDVEIAGDPLAAPHLLPPAPAHPTTVADFVGLLRALVDAPERWRGLVRYDATLRWYHRLRQGPGYEVWLLSWLPGQGSGWHDHGEASGVYTVLQGELTERARGRVDGRCTERSLGAGAVRSFASGYVHEVVNGAWEPAVSAHVYHPALTEMRRHCASAPTSAGAVGAPVGP